MKISFKQTPKNSLPTKDKALYVMAISGWIATALLVLFRLSGI